MPKKEPVSILPSPWHIDPISLLVTCNCIELSQFHYCDHSSYNLDLTITVIPLYSMLSSFSAQPQHLILESGSKQDNEVSQFIPPVKEFQWLHNA